MTQINYTRKNFNLNIGGYNMLYKDDFKNLLYSSFLQAADLERQNDSTFFLLSESESKLLNKAYLLIEKNSFDIFSLSDPKTKKPEKDKMQEIVKKTIEDFKNNKLSIKKLRAISDRTKTALFWYVYNISDNYYLISIVNQDKFNNIEVNKEHAFFAADNMRARAAALGLSDLYLYVSRFELSMLNSLFGLFNVYDSLNNQLTPVIDSTPFYSFVSSPILNALSDIGANAKKPTITKKKNEHGQQITIAEYLTKSGGLVKFQDFTPFAAGGFITVGDPNTDKLLFQAQLKAMQTGQQYIEIPITTEFKEFRKLTDNKSALEQAEQACMILRRAGYDINIQDNSGAIVGGWNYVQKCFVEHRGNKAGNIIIIEFTNDVFGHIMTLSKKGQQIEQLDKKIMTIPDNQSHAYNIARKMSHHVRFNADKNNSHIIGVKTLIDSCPLLPLYPESSQDAGKENYLRFKSEASERIIKKVVRALDFLCSYGILESYKLKKSKGAALTNEEKKQAYKDYELFISLNVEFKFSNEPNYQKLIESKAQAPKREKQSNRKKSNKEQSAPRAAADSKIDKDNIKNSNNFFKDL